MMLPTPQTTPIALAIATAALCLSAGACLAQPLEPAGGGVRASGFGTVGITHAEAPDGWGYLRDYSQPGNSGGTRSDIDSRLGLQLNYTPSAQFELVGQLLATRRLSTAKRSDTIEWGFAAFRPNADLTLRAGRVNVDQFLMSDYRNVGFAYPFARPPVDFYALLPASLDGADMAWVWNVDGTRWRAKAFAGRAQTGQVQLRQLYGAMVSREADGLLLRAGLTRTRLTDTNAAVRPLLDGLGDLGTLPVPEVAAQAAGLRERLDLTGAQVNYAALGVSYDWHDWQLSGELTSTTGHPAVNFVAGYMAVARRIGQTTVYGLASRIRIPEAPASTPAWDAALEPVLGSTLAQQAQFLGAAATYAVNVNLVDQSTLAVGARWDIYPRLALKVQWDHVRIGANSGLLWANATPSPGRANIGSVVLDFVF